MERRFHSIEDNKAVVRRFAEEILNEKKLDRADQIMAQDYLDHAAIPGQGPGLQDVKQKKWAMWVAPSPSCVFGPTTCSRRGPGGGALDGRGTHPGELMGVPPTGKQFRFTGLSIFRVTEGKIAEQWEGGTGWT